jgi:hypothetical protein
VFRRRSTDAPEAPDLAETGADDPGQPPRPGVTPKKGAPTPKRSQAEANRRQAPYQAPPDRKTAARLARERDTAARQRQAEALRRGDESGMPAKDRGPVRALARNLVDSRRSVGEFYMIILIPLIASVFLKTTTEKQIAEAVVFAALAVLAFETWFVARKARKLAAERFPGESTRGLTPYIMVRNMQLRKMRIP